MYTNTNCVMKLKATIQMLRKRLQKSSWNPVGLFSKKMQMYLMKMVAVKIKTNCDPIEFFTIKCSQQIVSGHGPEQYLTKSGMMMRHMNWIAVQHPKENNLLTIVRLASIPYRSYHIIPNSNAVFIGIEVKVIVMKRVLYQWSSKIGQKKSLVSTGEQFKK